LGIYVAQVVLTNAHGGFWGTLPNVLQGAKIAILGNIFDKVLNNGGLLFHN